jgi:hypothetical protein
MAMSLLATLAATVVLSTVIETTISFSHREAAETFYAAEAGLAYAVHELRETVDWDAILGGDASSAFIDGAPGGSRAVGAVFIDFDAATADLNALNPSGAQPYRLYAHGYLADLMPTAEVRAYVIVWLADRSPAGASDPVLGISAQAYGPTGSRRGVEALLARVSAGSGGGGGNAVRFLSWSELR